jgi:hypothetical protein
LLPAFFLDYLTREDGTERLSRNVGNYQSTLGDIPETRISHLHRGGRQESRKKLHCLKYETVTLAGTQKVAFEVMAPCSMSEGHHCFKRIGCIHVHCRGLTVHSVCVSYSRYRKIFCFRMYIDLLVLRWIGSPPTKYPATHRR